MYHFTCNTIKSIKKKKKANTETWKQPQKLQKTRCALLLLQHRQHWRNRKDWSHFPLCNLQLRGRLVHFKEVGWIGLFLYIHRRCILVKESVTLGFGWVRSVWMRGGALPAAGLRKGASSSFCISVTQLCSDLRWSVEDACGFRPSRRSPWWARLKASAWHRFNTSGLFLD